MTPALDSNRRTPGRHSVARPDAWFVLVLIAGAGVYLARTTGGMTAFPGDLGDARFNQIVLEHLYHWATGREDSLWSPGFFHPFPGTLAFSDGHFGTGVFYAVWRVVGLSRELSFDLWYCTGALLTFWAAHYAFRRLGMGVPAAAAGAFVFAFALPALAQENHAQLVYRFPIPLAVLALTQYAQSRAVERLLRVAILVALQFLCSIYLGVFLAMLLGSIAVALAASSATEPRVSHSGSPRRRSWMGRPYGTAIEWALGIGLAAMVAYMLYEYLQVARMYRFGRQWEETQSMLPRLGSYLLADASPMSSWIGAWVKSIPMRHEHQLFPGLAVLVLACAGIAHGARHPKWRALTWVSVFSLACLVLISLDIDGTSAYRLLARLPGLNAIRAVSRIVLVQLLPLGVLAGIGVGALAESSARLRTPALLMVAALLSADAVLHTPNRTSFADARQRVEELRELASDAGVLGGSAVMLVLVNRWKDPHWMVEIDAMLLAQDLGIRTMNGYSGNAPPGFVRAGDCSDVRRWVAGIDRARAQLGGQAQRITFEPDAIRTLPREECAPFR